MNRIPSIVTALLLVSLGAKCANVPSTTSQALVTVHADRPGAMIPPDFLGLSYEKSVLIEPHFRPDNTELVNLYRGLGPGVLRFGGNRVELTYWQRAAPAASTNVSKKGRQFIGTAALDQLYAFAKQCGWPVIHGLNLAGNDPAMAADEAAYALQVGGPQVLAFEVGNEPDYYVRHELRPAGYGYPQYRLEAENEQQAILAGSPRAPLAGPATTKLSDWFASFVADFRSRIVLATSHYYSLSAKTTNALSATFPNIVNLLSPSAKQVWQKIIEERQKAAHDAGLPFRLGECNSISNGGTDGVSDVFASALWGADFLFDAAEIGVAGINFHSGFSDRGYTPVCLRDGHYRPHPLYYSMLLFHQAAGGRVLPVECKTSVNLTAHAVLGDDGKLRVVLINKDLKHPAVVSIAPDSRRTQAGVIRLTAPSVNAREGVSLAGTPVGVDGTWSPQPAVPVPFVKGHFVVRLPAASAAVVTID